MIPMGTIVMSIFLIVVAVGGYIYTYADSRKHEHDDE